jgi:penicillin amidase
MKRLTLWILVAVAASILTASGCARLNSFQRDGDIRLQGLKAPVEVVRDEKGMAYIYAANEHDLLRAQGFVTAQDRLFQMELIRLLASGRISELAGPAGREADIRMRTIGFLRQGRKHAAILNDETARFLQAYLDGVNAFITRTQDWPLEFKLAGIRPTPWAIEDSLAIAYYMGWGSAANLKDEIIAQMLVEKLGPERAKELFPLNVNPDEVHECPTPDRIRQGSLPAKHHLDLASDPTLMAFPADQTAGWRVGSNNWATGASLSPSGRPIVANDPHLDARMLPGPWYPCGLILPSSRAVIASIPGVPGLGIGRTDRIALGVTNSYGDAQDLFIETVDPGNPGRYMEGGKSLPFEAITETLKIKDKSADAGFREEKVVVRLTKRGPVVSGVLKGLANDHVICLRWSPFETMAPSLGTERLLKARNVEEVRESLRGLTVIMLNFGFADINGNFGWQTTGRLPIRARGEGLVPHKVTDDRDDWTGWIPFDKMPHSYNPPRGWVGTCNHHAVPCDYPHYYTSHVSASYRYRRLIELLDAPGKKTVEDHWRFQRDTLNLMARRIAPVMSKALLKHEDTKALGRILGRWDFVEDPDQAAPAVFQAVYRRFFFAAYRDELGASLVELLADNPYFWQESLQKMVLAGESPWFDDVSTPAVRETRDDLLHRAGLAAIRELGPSYGSDPEGWRWGRMHRLTLVSPIRREGFAAALLGGGSHAMGGSQETLYRASYDYNHPHDVTLSASLRMVMDLGDPDKIMAVLPGGVSGRLFDPHSKDQVEPFMNGGVRYWWFSDRKIRENARTTLRLLPETQGEASDSTETGKRDTLRLGDDHRPVK